VLIGVDTQHLERPDRDLIVSQAGHAERRQLKVVTHNFLHRLLPGRHACLTGRQERTIDVPEKNGHAICGTT
jgi:hypothetical protein